MRVLDRYAAIEVQPLMGYDETPFRRLVNEPIDVELRLMINERSTHSGDPVPVRCTQKCPK